MSEDTSTAENNSATTTTEETTPVVNSGATQAVTPVPEVVSKDEHSKVQREAQNLRARLKEAEEAKSKLELSLLSEQERKDKRLAELEASHAESETKYRDAVTFYSINLEAQKLGVIDPDAAAALMDWDSLEYGDDGRPSNVKEELEKLVASKPYLKAQVTPPVSSGMNTNVATHDPANPNSPEIPENWDYNYWTKNKDKIQLALRNGTL